MGGLVRKFWDTISNAGVEGALSKRDSKSIVGINRAWLVYVLIQAACLCLHIINGVTVSAVLTGIFIVLLIPVHILMRMGKINAAKITALIVINYNTVLMAIMMGVQTHLIEFLFLSAIMSLYLFETHQKRMLILGISVSLVPYAIYNLTKPLFYNYGLPYSVQLGIAETSAWVMMFCIIVLLYLIYNKNNAYEHDAQETETRLVEQKKLYENILEQIPVGIVTFDKDLRYTYLNSAAVKDDEMRAWMLGKTNMEYFVARNLDTAGAYERDKILHDAINKGTGIEIEETLTDRHGNMKSSVKGAAPVYGNDGELLTLIGYSLDITSIKDAERQVREYAHELERKNEDLRHFVYATSHDLKSPLRNIASHLQILQRRNKENLDGESLTLIDYTVTSVKHLNQLINDIYQYSVADNNEKPAENISLVKVVAEIVNEQRSIFAERNAKIEYSMLPELRLAPSHIGMVLGNLIGNAVKYNQSEHPMVHVYSHESDTEFIITVADNGIGISDEYHKQIFEIFRRLHTSDVYEGTGVGLAICKKIVENYGGRIWVESVAGKGSKFHFSLLKSLVMPQDDYIIGPFNELGELGATG